MGGKEGLSALGWSRVRLMDPDGYPPELWGNCIGDSLLVSAAGARKCHKLNGGGCSSVPIDMTADELRACMRRIEELEAGDAK